MEPSKCDDLNADLQRVTAEANAFRNLANRNAAERDDFVRQVQQLFSELDESQRQHNLHVQEYQRKLLLAKFTPTEPAAPIELPTTTIIKYPHMSSTQSLIDSVDKLASTQDQLKLKKTKDKQLENHLRKFRVDIEAKAPLLEQQPLEYELSLHEKQNPSERLYDLLKEHYFLQNQFNAADSDARQYKAENNVLAQENKDLAEQVQTLLGQHLPKGEDLVTFSDIQKLQSQNRKLLRKSLTLTSTLEELHHKLDQDKLQSSLDAAMEELTQLKEERERQATIANSIVQQRDMYRALLAKSDPQTLEQEGTSKREDPALHERMQTLQNDLIVANNDKEALQLRNKKLPTSPTSPLPSTPSTPNPPLPTLSKPNSKP